MWKHLEWGRIEMNRIDQQTKLTWRKLQTKWTCLAGTRRNVHTPIATLRYRVLCSGMPASRYTYTWNSIVNFVYRVLLCRVSSTSNLHSLGSLPVSWSLDLRYLRSNTVNSKYLALACKQESSWYCIDYLCELWLHRLFPLFMRFVLGGFVHVYIWDKSRGEI